jgi:hypothetical protein
LKAKLRLETDIKKCNQFEEKIKKVEAKIARKIENHKNLEIKNPEKAIRGFAMLKSMIARERLIVGYDEGKVKRCCMTYLCCRCK